MHNTHLCPVVGIGASAGGLEALKKLFAAMPADSGAAFIVVPHLDPTHESLMVPLLAACTTIPVSETTPEALIEPNHVYVIPPNRYLSLADGRFLLDGPVERSQAVLDLFLRALAADQKDNAICVILSGTGAHGSQGVRAIKSQGGLTMAQEPGEAQFPDMPKNAIATEMVDVVCPVEKMPQALLHHLHHFAGVESATAVTDSLDEILALLRAQGRLDFRSYCKRMLQRRIRRRMGLAHLKAMSDYLALLRSDPQEIKRLERDLTISVTRFFRDPGLFLELEKGVIPALVSGKADDEPIRIWVPGCATGEEAYSLGMLLLEALSAAGKRCPVKIFATDVDESGLDVARTGLYPHTIEADVSAVRLARFFHQTGSRAWRVAPVLREAVTFARHDILGDTPFSKMDLVSCRNLLIYLEPPMQRRVIQMFHFALNPDGCLILGPSETVGPDEALFQTVVKKWRVFRRIGRGPASASGLPGTSLPFSGLRPLGGHPNPIRSEDEQIAHRAEQALLARFAPASVVVRPKGQIVHFHGPTSLFLSQPTGKPTHDLFLMAPIGLRAKLRALMRKLTDTPARSVRATVSPTGNQRRIGVSAIRLPGPPDGEPLLLLAFDEEPSGRRSPATSQETTFAPADSRLDDEVSLLREELQTRVGELQDANEDLKSSAEELISMNEEMQSANEELETSKEELQSLNEELTSVNSQLQDKVEALEQATGDMDNLLRSSEIAVLFLDRELLIRWFSPAIQPLISLIAGDVGRPLVDIALRVSDPDLLDDARSVLETLAPAPREIRDDRNRWWLRRIVPYCAADHRVDGVVITFTDIDAVKSAAAQVRRLDTVLMDSNDAVIVRDLAGRITAWNRAATAITGYSEAEVRGLDLAHFVPAALRAQEQERYARLARGEAVPSWETQRIAKDGHLIHVWVTATAQLDEQGLPVAILTTARDITERKRKEEQLGELNLNLERLVIERTQALEQANRRLTQEIKEHRQAEAEVRRLNESLEERVAQRTRELTRANRNLEKFSYSVAHDLRAPLRAIHGFASILEESLGGQANGEQREYFDRIKANSVRMGDLIDDILAFSRLSRAEMEIRRVDMEALARKSVAQMTGLCPQAQVHIAPLPPAYADPALLQCVFENLLSNALKFSAKCEAPVVEVGVEESAEGETVFFVSDNGAGFDMGVTTHLFDPFIRLHDSAAYPGTGVGLAIVKNVIERHHGRVWAQAAPGQGAKFSFILGKPSGEPEARKTSSPAQP